jgi:hypothetical protein
VSHVLAFVLGVVIGVAGTRIAIRVWLTARWSEKG